MKKSMIEDLTNDENLEKEDWEEEFDKEYPACNCKNNMPPHFSDQYVNRDWIKVTIRQIIEKEKEKSYQEGCSFFAEGTIENECIKEQARQEMKEDLYKKIGMIKRWLDEERITNPKKILTKEEIECWLFAVKTNKINI
ncbi:MAG: hypothetical protein V3574_04305 [Candidatus Moraniibacteriota bacterium]